MAPLPEYGIPGLEIWEVNERVQGVDGGNESLHKAVACVLVGNPLEDGCDGQEIDMRWKKVYGCFFAKWRLGVLGLLGLLLRQGWLIQWHSTYQAKERVVDRPDSRGQFRNNV